MPLEVGVRCQREGSVGIVVQRLVHRNVVRVPACLDAVLRDALAGLLAEPPSVIALPAVFGDLVEPQLDAGHGRQFVEVEMQEGWNVEPAGRERGPAVDKALGDQQHDMVLWVLGRIQRGCERLNRMVEQA